VGYDAGKRTKGRKRHLLTDTLGLPLRVVVHSADIQDRDGAALVLDGLRARCPHLELVWADAGYLARQVNDAVSAVAGLRIEIVKRSQPTGWQLLPSLGHRANLRLVRPQRRMIAAVYEADNRGDRVGAIERMVDREADADRQAFGAARRRHSGRRPAVGRRKISLRWAWLRRCRGTLRSDLHPLQPISSPSGPVNCSRSLPCNRL
jgi:transposase